MEFWRTLSLLSGSPLAAWDQVSHLLFLFFLVRAVSATNGSSQAGVKLELELQLLAYTTATETPALSHISRYTIACSNAGSLTH